MRNRRRVEPEIQGDGVKTPCAGTRYLWLLCLMIAINQCGLALYLPSLPSIAVGFHASTALAQNTVMYYVVGIAASQLVYGPLSDHYGRKRIALIGMSIFAVGTVVAVCSWSIAVLLLARLIQGIGIGAATIVSRAVLRDVFQGSHYVKAGARLASIVAVMPMIAPVLGGYLQTWLGWRANFIVLLFFSLLMIVSWYRWFAETAVISHARSLSIKSVVQDYWQAAQSRVFVKSAVCGGLTYAGEIVILGMAPFAIQTQLGVSTTVFGWLLLLLALGFMAGARLSICLANYLSGRVLIQLGLGVTCLMSVLLLFLMLLHVIVLWSLMVVLVLFMLGTGLVYPNTSLTAVGQFPDKAGTASALFSGIQGGLASISGLLLGCLSGNSLSAFSWLLLGLSVLASGVFYYPTMACYTN